VDATTPGGAHRRCGTSARQADAGRELRGRLQAAVGIHSGFIADVVVEWSFFVFYGSSKYPGYGHHGDGQHGSAIDGSTGGITYNRSGWAGQPLRSGTRRR